VPIAVFACLLSKSVKTGFLWASHQIVADAGWIWPVVCVIGAEHELLSYAATTGRISRRYMKKRLIIGVFLGVFCATAGFGQRRIVVDARVDLATQGEVNTSNQVTEPSAVGAGPFDTFAQKRGRAKRGREVSIQVGGLDRRLVAAVYRESARYRIDPRLVFSLIWQESGGKLHVISPKGARGPLQLMPGTAARYGARNAFDPDQAVRAGVWYLVDLLDEFQGNVSQALAAYNAGAVPVYAFSHGKRVVLANNKVVNPRAVKTIGGIPPYPETENYVESIARNYRSFRQAENRVGTSR